MQMSCSFHVVWGFGVRLFSFWAVHKNLLLAGMVRKIEAGRSRGDFLHQTVSVMDSLISLIAGVQKIAHTCFCGEL
jgi:hypothetical protein